MLIKSVSVTFSVLRAFVGRRGPLTLKEISFQSGLPPSKAHRYLRSLIREGMITQDPRSRLYALGATAISLGLEALENTDPVVAACEVVRTLGERCDVAVSVDVMSPMGPICIWYEQPVTQFAVPVRLGATRQLLGSAAGHVFLAFLPRHVTRALAAAEARQAPFDGHDPDAIAHAVRSNGHAAIAPGAGSNAYSLAAPVLDARGDACAAISFYASGFNTDDERLDILLDAADEASALKRRMPAPRLAEAV